MDIDRIKTWPFPSVVQDYDWRDTILYALGVGCGANPTDPIDLSFVYEDGLKAIPSMCVVLGYPGPWMRDPAARIDWVRMLHGEQAIELHRPLPSSGRVRAEHRITGVEDKGADKGALMVIERTLFDDTDGELLATQRQTMFLRGDGGCGGFGTVAKAAARLPEAAPDRVAQIAIAPNQALIYRLSGDFNPVHIDPAVAGKAGFPRPILHGLASFGIAARIIIREYLDGDPARLGTLSVRFSSPAYPEDILNFEFHENGDGILFRAIAANRNKVILDGCSARFV